LPNAVRDTFGGNVSNRIEALGLYVGILNKYLYFYDKSVEGCTAVNIEALQALVDMINAELSTIGDISGRSHHRHARGRAIVRQHPRAHSSAKTQSRGRYRRKVCIARSLEVIVVNIAFRKNQSEPTLFRRVIRQREARVVTTDARRFASKVDPWCDPASPLATITENQRPFASQR
jgi:hypothetical protein